jgi:hypothetical protein
VSLDSLNFLQAEIGGDCAVFTLPIENRRRICRSGIGVAY